MTVVATTMRTRFDCGGIGWDPEDILKEIHAIKRTFPRISAEGSMVAIEPESFHEFVPVCPLASSSIMLAAVLMAVMMITGMAPSIPIRKRY